MKTFKLLIPIFTLVGLTFLVTACPPKLVKKNKGQVYFVHGDPMNIIEGATLNQEPYITKDNYQEFDGFTLTTYLMFQRKSNTQEKEITDFSITSEDGLKLLNGLFDFSFLTQHNSDGSISELRYVNSTGNLGMIFHLDKGEGNKFKLQHMKSDEGLEDVEMLHYSFNQKHNAFSLLITDKKKTYLAALFFTKDSPKFSKPNWEVKGNEKYEYVRGKGVRQRWPKSEELKVNVCGERIQQIKDDVIENIKPWKKHLKKNKLLTLKTGNKRTEYPPYSDLNSNCIYSVDNYVIRANMNIVQKAVTYNISNIYRSEFISSQIILWEREHTLKNKASFNDNFYSLDGPFLIMHEMGHLLGLDHKMDGTYSVMSYDYTATGLTEYDKEAINHLYGP